jgi:hypothetical protein
MDDNARPSSLPSALAAAAASSSSWYERAAPHQINSYLTERTFPNCQGLGASLGALGTGFASSARRADLCAPPRASRRGGAPMCVCMYTKTKCKCACAFDLSGFLERVIVVRSHSAPAIPWWSPGDRTRRAATGCLPSPPTLDTSRRLRSPARCEKPLRVPATDLCYPSCLTPPAHVLLAADTQKGGR